MITSTEICQSTMLQDERYLARRHEEFKRAMEVWAKQLNQIVSVAPLQRFKVNLQAKNDWVKNNFPEFYPL